MMDFNIVGLDLAKRVFQVHGATADGGTPEIADFCDSGKHVGECARADPPEVGLELGECHFDGVEIGTVRRQEQEPAPCVPHRLGRCDVLVCSEIIQDDDTAGFQFWDQHFFDVSCEGWAIHRAFDHPGSDQSIGGETRDERLCSP